MLRLAFALVVLAAPLALSQGAPTIRAVDDGGEADYHFAPARLSTPVGAHVTVVGGSTEPHTVSEKAATPAARRFDSGNVDPGATGGFTAPMEPGEYAFLCIYHPGMTGVLIVEPPTTHEDPFPTWAALVALPLAGLLLRGRARV